MENHICCWGSGIPRIIDEVKAAGLQEPEFIGGDVDLRINIYRDQIEVNNAKRGQNGGDGGESGGDDGESGGNVPPGLNETERIVYLQVSQDGTVTAAQMSENLGLAKRTIERALSKLREKGLIMRIGSSRSGKWEIRK